VGTALKPEFLLLRKFNIERPTSNIEWPGFGRFRGLALSGWRPKPQETAMPVKVP
jgi:hypothetical protein